MITCRLPSHDIANRYSHHPPMCSCMRQAQEAGASTSEWIRDFPTVFGAAGIAFLLANRALSNTALVSDASSAQSRADVLVRWRSQRLGGAGGGARVVSSLSAASQRPCTNTPFAPAMNGSWAQVIAMCASAVLTVRRRASTARAPRTVSCLCWPTLDISLPQPPAQGLSWRSLKPKEIVYVQPSGEKCYYFNPQLPPRAAAELKWVRKSANRPHDASRDIAAAKPRAASGTERSCTLRRA